MHPRRPQEGCDRARALVRDLGGDAVHVDRLLREPEGATGNRRNQRHFVALGQSALRPRVFAIHGIEKARGRLTQVECVPHVADAGAFRQLRLELARAVPLAQAGEELDDDPHPASVDGQRGPRTGEGWWALPLGGLVGLGWLGASCCVDVFLFGGEDGVDFELFGSFVDGEPDDGAGGEGGVTVFVEAEVA